MRQYRSAWRFVLTGIAATAVHTAAAVAAIEGLRFNPAVANGMAFLFTNLFSYVVNSRWSFAADLNLARWGRFLSVSLLGWLCAVVIAWGVEATGRHYVTGILCVAFCVPLLSFAAHRLFTFRDVTCAPSTEPTP
ncbi:MAG: GtrA family protein [Deltaproteobacteria bacterium]|nr:GtrA family protein [Deltaproteobacteria bacterium]